MYVCMYVCKMQSCSMSGMNEELADDLEVCACSVCMYVCVYVCMCAIYVRGHTYSSTED